MTDDAKITVALVTGLASVIVALLNAWLFRSTQKKLELLKEEIENRRAERDARRDYEYEAKKRLYQECEPLLFQLYEVSENALHRIYSLARTARLGNLDPESSWLEGNGYYMASTIYSLLAPVSVFKLIHRRLTFVDLAVEPHIRAQYNLAKSVYISFTDHFDFAGASPRIPYNPSDPRWRVLRESEPSKYWRQGIPFGWLDTIAEKLLREQAGALRLMSFGEFEAEYHNEGSPSGEIFSIVTDLFWCFHPRTRPVLWRMLVAQAHIYRALLEIARTGAQGHATPLRPIPRGKRKEFEWRGTGDQEADAKVFDEPFSASEEYLRARLSRQFAG